MKTTNNLRRGNSLKQNGDDVTVLTIAKSALRVYNYEKGEAVQKWFKIEEFESIDITPDELINLNFMPITDNGGIFIATIGNIDLRLLETQNGWDVRILGEKAFTIRFVHEIENLIYTLNPESYA